MDAKEELLAESLRYYHTDVNWKRKIRTEARPEIRRSKKDAEIPRVIDMLRG